jgi:hypothetical protein
VGEAMSRAKTLVERLQRKHKTGTVALVVPEPLACLVVAAFQQSDVGDLWKVECQGGDFQLIEAATPMGAAAVGTTATWRGVAYPIP